MNEKATAAYGAGDFQSLAQAMAGPADHKSLKCTASRAVYFLNGRGRVEKDALPAAIPETQVEEEGEFYIPELLSNEDYEPRPALYFAAEAHARRLRKAECHIDEALNLSQVLRASMCDAGDSRAMQVETVLKIVEKKLSKAHFLIDKYDASHMNLFMAYIDLRDKSDGG